MRARVNGARRADEFLKKYIVKLVLIKIFFWETPKHYRVPFCQNLLPLTQVFDKTFQEKLFLEKVKKRVFVKLLYIGADRALDNNKSFSTKKDLVKQWAIFKRSGGQISRPLQSATDLCLESNVFQLFWKLIIRVDRNFNLYFPL